MFKVNEYIEKSFKNSFLAVLSSCSVCIIHISQDIITVTTSAVADCKCSIRSCSGMAAPHFWHVAFGYKTGRLLIAKELYRVLLEMVQR